MKTQTNKTRTELSFEVDDWVYLKLQPYRQLSASKQKQQKLSKIFYKPLKITQ